MKKELLLIMFLLGVSIALINITPEINQADSGAPQLKENKDINLGINENKKIEDSSTPVTFDIIRISQDGDTIMAGKSEPNLEIFLFENKKKISSFFSDANGEWLWISDNPLTEGLKIFNIRCINEEGKEFESSQEIYVLGDEKSSVKPMVLKLDSINFDDINIYNTEYIDNSLTLDILNYYPKKKLTISGRAPVGIDVNVFASIFLLPSSFVAMAFSSFNSSFTWLGLLFILLFIFNLGIKLLKLERLCFLSAAPSWLPSGVILLLFIYLFTERLEYFLNSRQYYFSADNNYICHLILYRIKAVFYICTNI